MKQASGTKTDAELAAVCGVSKGAPANWRKEGVPLKHLLTISERFHRPIELLRTGRLEMLHQARDPDEEERTNRIARAARRYQDQRRGRGEMISTAAAVEAVTAPAGAVHELSEHDLALALVEAEQERQAERPGEAFRASQLAGKVTRIIRRHRYIYEAARRSGTPHNDIAQGIREALGLAQDWTPRDPW